MKLRNKKTGEVVDLSIFGIQLNIRKEEQPVYHSLVKLNEEWEDYKPVEPLIKDEKIRKVVRAWADWNMIKEVQYDAFWMGFRNHTSIITVWDELPLDENKVYTIAELCGKEEE